MNKVLIITGHRSGLGKALMELAVSPISEDSFLHEHQYVIGLDIAGNDIYKLTRDGYEELPWEFFDIPSTTDVSNPSSWKAIRQFVNDLNYDREAERGHGEGRSCYVSCIVNCAGINCIDWLENVTTEDYDRLMGVNAKSIMLSAQAFKHDLIETQGVICNVVSNAAHMPMTNSLAYNASKAAAWIITEQLARELTKKDGITVFGVAPNKMSGTLMSQYIEERVPEVRGWTPEQAEQYQQASLMAGETPPEKVAEFMAFLLFKHNPSHLSGCILPYGK